MLLPVRLPVRELNSQPNIGFDGKRLRVTTRCFRLVMFGPASAGIGVGRNGKKDILRPAQSEFRRGHLRNFSASICRKRAWHLLTHISPAMTARYAHLTDDALKRAASVADRILEAGQDKIGAVAGK